MYTYLELTHTCTYSLHGLKDVDRYLFVNERCVEEYGEPRSQEECSRLLSLLSEEAREKRRTWLTKAALVSPALTPRTPRIWHSVRAHLLSNDPPNLSVYLRRGGKGIKHGLIATSC